MSIATQRREKNINAELDDMRNKANSVLSQMNSLMARARNYTAWMYTSLANGSGEVDQVEVDRYSASIAQMSLALDAMLPSLTDIKGIQGATQAETDANLAAFITKYTVDTVKYNTDFN